jgi:hypothetical protein
MDDDFKCISDQHYKKKTLYILYLIFYFSLQFFNFKFYSFSIAFK